ncbi:MAG: penicillin-binding protein 2 [Lentisphaeria bacterium]|nr:penicillin-binding protein 2 [Lentisphaeria bacterium]
MTEPETAENTGSRTILIRVMILAFLVMLMFSVLLIRLWSVQVLSGWEFDEKASRQYVRSIRLSALRGRIISSDGRLLATNRPSIEVRFHLSEMPLSGKLNASADYILQKVKQVEKCVGRESGLTQKDVLYHMQHYPGVPMVVLKELDQAELARIAEFTPKNKNEELPGMELAAYSTRVYPDRSLACHLIGYTGPQDPTTAEDRSAYSYYQRETTGRAGLEKKCNELLRGRPGRKLVKVNHRGFVHEVIEEQPAEPAADLILTLDARLQAKAESLLRGRSGAIVMLDANDGSVLAAASSPGYDLNRFIPRILSRDYREIENQPGKPFLNKALQDAYMPGSIIKPLIALAMLENGVSPDDETDCNGATYFSDGSRIRCWAWQSGGHGSLSLTSALKVSCNDFFIENGMKLGLEKIRDVFISAGLGSRTGIGLQETAGVLPDRKRWPKWNAYETALISIGQGKLQISPIQAASYAAALANGGELWTPRLIREISWPETGKTKPLPPKLRGRLKATPENIAIVREGMYRAVNEPGGGGANARLSEFVVSGKTGTAEVNTREGHSKNTWFIGFAELPSERLTAVSVLVLDGEAGNRTAAPLAAEMFRCAAKLKL